MEKRYYFLKEGEVLLILAQLEETVHDLKEILESKNLVLKESEKDPVEIRFSVEDIEPQKPW